MRRLLERLHFLAPLVVRVVAWRVGRAVRDAGCEFVASGAAYEVRRGAERIRFSSQHVMFAPELARQFDQYFHATTASGDEYLRDFTVPALHFMPSADAELWVSGVTEGVEHIREHLLHHAPAPGSVVFDVGANCGASALLLARAVGPAGRVHAYEPDPLNRELLRRNVERLALANVTIHPEAMAGTTGHRRFNAEGSVGSALSDLVSRAGIVETIVVPTVSLEEACARAGAAPSFIKMDAEVAEIEILTGATDWLRQHPTQLMIDTSHIVRGECTDVIVEKILRGAGYEAYTEEFGGLRTTFGFPPAAA